MRISRGISFTVTVLAIAIALVLVLQVSAVAASFTEYSVPTLPSFPYYIAAGPDGAMWFTENVGNNIGRINMAGKITEYPIPTEASRPSGIVSHDGDLWFVEWVGNKVGRCTTSGGFTEYEVPTLNSGPWAICAGPDGALWFTENAANKIGRFTTSGDFTEYEIPTANSGPFGIVAGPDGALWFTEANGNRVGRCTTSGKITEHKISTAGSLPAWITAGPDGALWFTEWNGNKIGRCTTSGAITEHKVPTANSTPAGITTGPDGALWFTEAHGNKVGRCTTSGAITNEYEIQTADSGSNDIAVGPDGRLWFCEWGRNQIGRMVLPTPRWFLAEGTTAWGFSTYITITNPNVPGEYIAITYMTPEGPVVKKPLYLPPISQTMINPKDDLKNDTDFSTYVECLSGNTIAVDRTMSWTGPQAASPEGHSSIGVTAPAKTWYLAEGCSDYGFETWLLIQNPNAEEASVKVTYQTEGWGAQSFDKKVPANSRATFNMADDIGKKNASIKVESNLPVIPERSMYRNNRREGSDSIGTTTPADSFLAEGSTSHGFTTYVLVQNPNDSETTVNITYMTTTGPTPQVPFILPANSRKTIRVNDVLPDADFSTIVDADKPIVAERAMYWGADTPLGEACHDSIALSATHNCFYLPDGQSSGGYETYTLVGNPNDTAVEVEVIYLAQDGKGIATVTQKIAAKSRFTFNMNDTVPGGRASIMVDSLTPGKNITVERSMYWNNRGAGTSTIGCYTD